jgi:hypothetical protein
MSGNAYTQEQYNVGDEYTLRGFVTAISGTGALATVTVETALGDIVSLPAKQCHAPQTEGPAMSADGKHFSVGDAVNISATVVSITGTGASAQVTSSVVTSAPVGANTAAAAPAVTATTITHTAVVAVVKKKK